MKKLKLLRDILSLLGFYSIGFWIVLVVNPDDGVILSFSGETYSYLVITLYPFILSFMIFLLFGIFVGIIYIFTNVFVKEVSEILKFRYKEEDGSK